ncbi:hypothetical protein IIC65_05195 [Candidatus Sumerlaeota bacterium]|nr:hypothetical protein [Candidatus Sumerlaeota bacterium]
MSSPALKTSPSEVEIDHLGLIAGEGKFPFLIARAARSRSVPVTAIGVHGVTSPELEAEVDEMRWVKFGEFDQMIQHFHDSGISKAVMAGRIKHSSIFQLAQLDSRGRKLISKLVNKKADTVLSLVAQVADIGGFYLVSFVVVLVNAALAECVLAWQQGTRRRLPLVVGTAFGVLGACLIYGLIACAVYTPRDDDLHLRVLLVQGNIDTPSRVGLPPAERLKRDIETWNTQLRLTEEELARSDQEGPDLIVWSETLLPGTINTNRSWRTLVQKKTDAFRVPLLAGANTDELDADGRVEASYNSACLFLPVVPGEEPVTQGRLAGRYDKRHLVPFGEFVPWPLKGHFNPLTHSGYTPGAART